MQIFKFIFSFMVAKLYEGLLVDIGVKKKVNAVVLVI